MSKRERHLRTILRVRGTTTISDVAQPGIAGVIDIFILVKLIVKRDVKLGPGERLKYNS